MQFVRLVNRDNRPFDFHQSNKKRILQPGQEAMVPWDIATSLFGDPAAIDTTTDQARTRVWKQSRGQFGYQSGSMTMEEWEELRPKVEVYDVETGERIYMVIEDPEGNLYGPNRVMSNDTINAGALEAQLAHMQKQVDTLTQLLLAQNAQTAPQGQSVVSSEDDAGDGIPASGGGAIPMTPGVATEDVPQTPPVGPAPKTPKGKLAPRTGE